MQRGIFGKNMYYRTTIWVFFKTVHMLNFDINYLSVFVMKKGGGGMENVLCSQLVRKVGE